MQFSVSPLLRCIAVASVLSVISIAGAQQTNSSAVSFWSATEAFARGPLLLDRLKDGNYQVYAVGRDKPGAVELHDVDTDIIFVLEGSATFVTGGSITERRPLRPNESTGTGIRDGKPQRLGPGDVIVVPNGTPHWFQDVTPAIRYFAVKLRQANAQPASPARVMHWTGEEAFAKGGLLLSAAEGRSVRIYALRRSQPLGVELHGVDTDIVFVMGGAGTFVTDGTIDGQRPIGPGEMTGTDIVGGTPRRVARGDALVMPRGTPHWLRDVDASIDFFAVKVR